MQKQQISEAPLIEMVFLVLLACPCDSFLISEDIYKENLAKNGISESLFIQIPVNQEQTKKNTV